MIDLRGLYFLDDLNGYIACRKGLEISESIVKITNENSIRAGTSVKMAELILKADEEHIHNYFLDENEYNITFDVENNNCKEENICSIDYGKSSIEGIYNLKFKSNQAAIFKIIGTINGQNLKNNENSFTVKVDPIPEAHYLEMQDGLEEYSRHYEENSVENSVVVTESA